MIKKTPKKNVTVFDVAAYAGVSKSTVSLVLTGSSKVSEKSKAKVLEAMDKLGYVYNRDAASLRGKRRSLVAIVINDLSNPYSAQLAIGLEKYIRAMGLFSILVNSAEDVETQGQLVDKLKEYKVAAFIICPAPYTTAEWINDLVVSGFPVINIMRKVAGAQVPTVLPDNITGTEQSTAHLIEKGFKHIAFLGGRDSISDYHDRLAGYKNAMTDAGLACDPRLQVQTDANRHGGRQAIGVALDLDPELDAVVCFNDVIAYGVIEQLRMLGREPGKDLAIVGFDDLEDSRLMSPALSTVSIDADRIGHRVCRLLERLQDQEQISDTILVDVKFVERDSA
ncbi:LacI family DNA-binding transcriptional regulator [Paremcibacter congregatus]|uniref:LacI family transcriptional regulator n=1 Tax=Paremcibacter congregatus TaxID=2043170 RepID=A0A2G4YW49_9PROT|nr:LacI family DNA-binding transcriptional regulator [Paremcibacter congregatus]PHZ86572.1 LacI family transcriptional regulator [Paremcibacter congregatus]QDE26377.1 substrate-binding domain-containing protein [Paremcibacter congregatus]|tara:strand:- start:11861 stop:12874 length:1014 start_codon:yes stop_codon:yes gene_type:complete